MRRNIRSNAHSEKKLSGKLPADRKKVAFAACLIVLMVIMWVRIFMKKAPGSVLAATVEQPNSQNAAATELNISYIELPIIPGRNDVITRDIFNSNGWKDFKGRNEDGSNVSGEVNFTEEDGNAEVMERIAQKLKLEAIIRSMGNNKRVLLNDKVLAVGQQIVVSDSGKSYECEVLEINDEEVVIRCDGAEITLRTPQNIGNSD